ncbi:Tfp pilus assembly protein PilO [Plantibacter flavus]|uniref:Tfp pilus assembly protein PilO n=1 Tax=Plantibacter flavus TaxID=150123 RepID=A0A3N2BXK7_9MICO|nr:hypothetical protein [Plantibacter flavus]ROR80015.1 Tfp pilus assembly protein PilO [Plantibacter flavus]SMG28550.1 Tfp pilus assembly protein PilO [Plantibacter flavus]
MKTSQARILLFAAPLTAVTVVLGGVALGAQPLLAQTGTTQAETATVRQGNTALQGVLDSLAGDAERIDDIRTEVEALRTAIPDQANMSSFLSELSGIAATSGVTLSGITVKDPITYEPLASGEGVLDVPAMQGGGRLLAIRLSLTVEGAPEHADTFLSLLRKSTRLFSIDSVSTGGSSSVFLAPPNRWTIGGYIFVLDDAERSE